MQSDQWNRRYSEKEPGEPSPPSTVLRETIQNLRPSRALDLAAGDGRNTLYLAERGWDVTAVDFSSVAVERGRKFSERLGLPVQWEIRDLTRYVPKDAPYDLVCLFYLHLLWAEFRTVLNMAAAAVSPGGKLLVVGHDRENIEAGGHGPRDPQVLYSHGEIVRELKGFEIERAETLRQPADHGSDPPGGVQVDCVVLARRVSPERPRVPEYS